MSSKKKVRSIGLFGIVLVLGAFLVVLSGCWEENEITDAGPAEQAGRRLDQATDKAGVELTKVGQGLSNRAEDTGKAIHQAGEQVGESLDKTTEKVGQSVEQVGERIQESTDN